MPLLSCVRANLNYGALCGVKEDRSCDASVEREPKNTKHKHNRDKHHFLSHSHLPDLVRVLALALRVYLPLDVGRLARTPQARSVTAVTFWSFPRPILRKRDRA